MSTFTRDPSDGATRILARVSAQAMRAHGSLPGYEGYIGSARALARDPTDACLPESIPYLCAVETCHAAFVPEDGFAFLCDRCQGMVDRAVAAEEARVDAARDRWLAEQWG